MYLEILIIMVALFAFMIPGFVLKKLKMIGEGGTLTLSNVLLYVCQPALAINSFCVFSSKEEMDAIYEIGRLRLARNFAIAAAITILAYIVIFLICKLIFIKWKNKGQANVYTFMAIFSNCGFLGLPFIEAFTDGNSLASMYLMVVNVVFLICVWTFGVYLLTGNVRNISPRKVFLNPAIITSVIGLLLFFVPRINFFMIDSVSYLQIIPKYLAYATAPLAMIIVGIRLADCSLRDIFASGGSYLSAAMRLLIAPAITLAIGLLFKGLLVTDEIFFEQYVYLAPVIAMAMSPASSVVAMSERFEGDTKCATSSYLLSTLLSIVTIPLMISLAMLI